MKLFTRKKKKKPVRKTAPAPVDVAFASISNKQRSAAEKILSDNKWELIW